MCKKQRAVLEALRFCRLIGNPKISTFNMLLSVCASSLDFDGNCSNLEVLAFLVRCARVGTEAWNMTKYFYLYIGALQVMELLKEAGLKPDCKLYTTLISTCAKCGKVDAMFEVTKPHS